MKLKLETKGYLFSLTLHIIIFIILYFLKVSSPEINEEYITLGFGTSGFGGISSKLSERRVETQQDNEEKIEIPKVKNTDNENKIIAKTEEKKEIKPKSSTSDIPNASENESGMGEGGEGFSIDFGGRGKRKIYHHPLPEYPAGVAKEIDIKLRFTILPDGTVSQIFPIRKADSRLENAAINSLSQWRFEPLPRNAKQISQTVVITFPYRLR
ncbi:MAG TPA: energy transducer TonB [Melioribacteraceae bacterium]|nr:energy transducer TonB [Melioribacteraceae bacterium]